MYWRSVPLKPHLNDLLSKRIPCQLCRGWIDQAYEVIAFGSIAAGVSKKDSDLDILLISDSDHSFKSSTLDLVGISKNKSESALWIGSELASHVKKYGIWLKGPGAWVESTSLDQRALDDKAKRIQAFLRSLPKAWSQLDEVFKGKYITKLRRETQRLIIMEGGDAVPPTRMLDEEWSSVPVSIDMVLSRLNELNQAGPTQVIDELVLGIGNWHRHRQLV